MILRYISRYQDAGLLGLRIGFGVLFILHGYPKLFGGPPAWEALGHAMSQLGIHVMPRFFGLAAAGIEFLGGICLIAGFLFRPACLLLGLTMGVAAVTHVGAGDPFRVYSHPLENAIVFLSLIFIGPGKYSID